MVSLKDDEVDQSNLTLPVMDLRDRAMVKSTLGKQSLLSVAGGVESPLLPGYSPIDMKFPSKPSDSGIEGENIKLNKDVEVKPFNEPTKSSKDLQKSLKRTLSKSFSRKKTS